MMKFRAVGVSLLALGFFVAVPMTANAQPAASAVETLAEYPAGTFLENLDVLADGRIIITNYFEKTIEILAPGAKPRTFAKLSAHPVSIRVVDAGIIVAAHGQPRDSGPGFTQSQQFLMLDRDGREVSSFKAPNARFLNGMVRHNNGKVLVADSIAATIWQIDPKGKTVEVWLKDDALAPIDVVAAPPLAPVPAPAPAAPAPAAAASDATGSAVDAAAATAEPSVSAPVVVAAPPPPAKPALPGANGLKRNFDRLVISNTSRGTLSTVLLGKDGSAAGKVEPLAQVGPIDDFAIGADGAIVFTTHGATLQRLAKDGKVSTLMATGCDGCTAVAFVKGRTGGRALAVLTTGVAADGSKKPSRVLRLPYL